MIVTGDWLTRPSTQAVLAMLEIGGHQALLVGGCVRNALLGVAVSDIDISTDARPERVLTLADPAGLKAIPTGIDHGTITVVADGIPHEITTFRKDVETDGRRAVVAFSDTVEDDAHRRDFTMNALYVRSDGTLVDPLGGLTDLKARRFRFIDDASLRIREDYLRILRYFRFHAWYGDPDAGLDPDALAAIAENSEGLNNLSKERVGSEMLKLLAAPDPAPSIAAMRQCGALQPILGGADDKSLAPLVHLESQLDQPADALRRLAALGGSDVVNALRLSKKQFTDYQALRDEIGSTTSPAELGYRLGRASAFSVALLRAALLEMPLNIADAKAVETGAAAKFPIVAKDLIERFQGPALGAKLKALETAWIASNFSLSKAQLLSL